MLTFAGQDALTRHLVQDYPVAQLVMLRYGLLALFALWWVQRRCGIGSALRSQRPWLQVARSLLSVTQIGIATWGFRHLGLADMHALVATFPLLVLALSGPILGESVGWRSWLAVAVGFGGTLVILRPGTGVFDSAALIGLGAAFLFALYNLLTRLASRSDRFETSMLYMGLIGCATSTAVGLPQWQAPSSEAWPLLIALAVASVLAQLLLLKALEYAPAPVLQPFNYSLLVFATLSGFVFFGELPDDWTLIGAAIVVASGLYAIGAGNKRRAPLEQIND